MRCLILGGAGFMGSHIADGFVESGYSVRVFDRPGIDLHHLRHSIESIDFIEGDFNDTKVLSAALQDMDVVINLVCTTLPGSSNLNPAYDVQSNVVANINFLEAAKKAGVKKVIFASSGGTVYGIPTSVPMTEEHPTNPICSYGITKLAVEKYLSLYYHLHGLEYVVLRISNPYGERQRPDSPQGVIAVCLGRLVEDKPFSIWGDGSVARDFLYISDVVKAFDIAAASNPACGVYNIGSGMAVTVNEIVSTILEVTGRKPELVHQPGRKLDVPVNCLGIAKAQNELLWKPEVPLKDGIRRTFEWMLRQGRI